MMFWPEPIQFNAFQRQYVLSHFGIDLSRKKRLRTLPVWVWPTLALGMLLENVPGSPMENAGWFPNLLWAVSLLTIFAVPLLVAGYAYLRAKEPQSYGRLVFANAVRSIGLSGSALIVMSVIGTVALSAVEGRYWLAAGIAAAIVIHATFLLYEAAEARRLLRRIVNTGEDAEEDSM